MIETARMEQWLYTTLAADTALTALVGTRIYSHVAPNEATFPLVVFGLQTAEDVMGVGPARIMAQAVYVVRVIGQTGSFGALKAAADRLDAVLHGASGSAGDGVVLACVRTQPFEMVETIAGVQYRHLGGLFRLWAQ